MTSISPEHQARQQRVARIRRRVVGGASGLFLVITGGIVVQLVSGHDPALAKAARDRVAAAPAPAPVQSAAPDDGRHGDGRMPGVAPGSSLGQVAPLTTSQS